MSVAVLVAIEVSQHRLLSDLDARIEEHYASIDAETPDPDQFAGEVYRAAVRSLPDEFFENERSLSLWQWRTVAEGHDGTFARILRAAADKPYFSAEPRLQFGTATKAMPYSDWSAKEERGEGLVSSVLSIRALAMARSGRIREAVDACGSSSSRRRIRRLAQRFSKSGRRRPDWIRRFERGLFVTERIPGAARWDE
jgi:hypothetical protein